ncbi:MAG: hypothetical protein M3362_00200 [Acidobacteriota bacterium]|nr:hypothetical protein [Acidobacteriota bacterium]
MNEEIQGLIKEVIKNWDYYKSKEVKSKEFEFSDNTDVRTVFGDTTAWDNPNLLWLLASINDGGWEGYGSQVGLTKDGRIVWEYQSHCSCDGFGDTSGEGHGELHPGAEMSKKSWELNELPDDWEKIVKVNLELILKDKPSN